MTDRPFVHLHCHSHYSLLDGAGHIDRLLNRAKERGMNALALTDHGNLHGSLEFYQAAEEVGIKPILGIEAYVAPQSRFNKEASGMKEASFHLTLLAQNRQGFHNLIKLSSSAFLEGFYYRPRIDKQLLEQWNDGIICLSGCISSEFNRALISGREPDMKKAADVATWYQKLFGDRYYLEIQNNGLEIQQRAAAYTMELGRQLGIPVVATSDVHYVDPQDHVAQDILLCINTGAFRTDANRMRMDTHEFYLRAPEEMYAAFPEWGETVARSQEIADRIDIKLELGVRHFPVFSPPDALSSEDYLRKLCEEGLRKHYRNDPERLLSDGQFSQEVIDRLERELGVINKLGFANYFLIVWDFVRFARDNGIEASARGSGVGSLVAFALELSHVCPLRYDLLFERFLDENRREAPDIDIDFCQERREEVIHYVKRRYGTENVSQIGTFGTLKSRQAIRDVGRALGLPIPRVDAVVALVPDDLKITIPKALKQSEDLKKLYDTDPEIREVLDLAAGIEGLARNIGTHAAGVVIGDRPLNEYVPLQHIPDKHETITQWDMSDVERAGLLKMDFLGLRNLTILSKVVRLIEQTTGQRIDPYTLPLDDPKTFELLCRGRTKGIFQFESGGIRDLLQKMKPDHFRDIIATNAMYRPGPLEGGMVQDYIDVKHARKQPEYKHPVMKEVLEETNGVMVYQEQVMRILNRLGGIQLANAYTCIKAISKKKLALIEKYREEFIAGSVAKGMAKDEAVETFALIEKFAGYGFNKSHSTAYAQIAYITAYLKAHYPVEFMAALLSSDIVNRNFKTKDSLVEHLEDCQQMDVSVLPPNVNACEAEFAVTEGKILFGLSAIKGCGRGAADAITQERKARGPFRDLFDLCERIDPGQVNRTAIESLVKAGALDCLGGTRAQWFAVIDRAFQSGASAASDRRRGQKGLFDDADETAEPEAVVLPDVPNWDDRDLLAKEKEVLGFYLSSHPLAEHEETLRTYCSHTTADAQKLDHRSEVVLGGIVSSVTHKHTKNAQPGRPSRYVMFDLEDRSGVMRTIMWPDQFVTFGEMIQPDAAIAVLGAIDKRPGSEQANLIVNEVLPITELSTRYTRGILFRVSESKHGQRGLEQLYEILRGYPGSCQVELLLSLADGSRVPCQCEKIRVELNNEMRSRVDALLGPGCTHLLAAPRTPQAPRNGGNGQGYGRARAASRN